MPRVASGKVASALGDGHGDLRVELARHDERLRDLEAWRAAVNGDLRDIKAMLSRLGWAVAATLGGVIADLLLRLQGIR